MSDREELRQAVATDAPAIRDLTRAAYAKWVPLIGREPKPMTADYAEAVRKHRFDLLYAEGSWPRLSRRFPKSITCSSRTWRFHRPFKDAALAAS